MKKAINHKGKDYTIGDMLEIMLDNGDLTQGSFPSEGKFYLAWRGIGISGKWDIAEELYKVVRPYLIDKELRDERGDTTTEEQSES